MSDLAYLGIAAAVSVLGALVLYARNRKPSSLQAGIEGFRRELQALAPNRASARPTPERAEGEDGRRTGSGA